MANAQRIKQLLYEIEKLPEAELGTVIDFVEFLASRREIAGPQVHSSLNHAFIGDPLDAFIGGIDEEPITSNNLDDEIYGH